jgi:hypothetical protein
MSQFNGPSDGQLTITQALPASNANVTTGILDLQAVAPSSDAWRLGKIAVIVPALPENTANTGITIALQAAPASLTGGSLAIAPKTPGPGAFVTPVVAQTATIAAVAASGSPAQVIFFNLAVDANNSTYQFYQFLITTPNGTVTVGEVLTFQWQYV